MEIKNVFIVASEQTLEVSCAVAEAAAYSGYNIKFKCENEKDLRRAEQLIKDLSNKRSGNGGVSERFQATTDLAEAGNADIAIESVFEDETLKKNTLAELDTICPAHTILATNTSTITVTELARATGRPENVIGMHFIYFSPVIKVVEVVRGWETAQAAFDTCAGFATSLEMETVNPEDTPGLISTRLWMVHLNEAANNVYNKLVEPASLVKLNRTISPNAMSILESADFIGLDNCVAFLRNLYHAYGDPKYVPSPQLMQMVSSGQLGMRSGKGFFNYS